MRNSIFILLMAMAIDLNAQVVERVDSIDMRTGVIYPANNVKVVDTIDCAEIGAFVIPQIPFEELDSLTMSSLDDRYVVVYKGGKCGVYDLFKEEIVTRIEYEFLSLGFRKEFEGEYFTYFRLRNDGKEGVLGIAEANNQFITILMPKEEEQ